MQALSQEVMDEAHAEADQILKEAREKAEKILQNARSQAEEQRKLILERAREEAERNHRQAIATAQVEARKIELEQREKLLRKVMDTAAQQLPSIQQWSNYDQITRQLLLEAVRRMNTNQADVLADEKTLSCLDKGILKDISQETGVKLNIKGKLPQGLGIVVETDGGRRRYDNTLETRLSRMQDSLRAPVYRLLMGESL